MRHISCKNQMATDKKIHTILCLVNHTVWVVCFLCDLLSRFLSVSGQISHECQGSVRSAMSSFPGSLQTCPCRIIKQKDGNKNSQEMNSDSTGSNGWGQTGWGHLLCPPFKDVFFQGNNRELIDLLWSCEGCSANPSRAWHLRSHVKSTRYWEAKIQQFKIEEKTLRAKTQRHQSLFNDSYGNEGVIYNNDCYGNHKCPHPCMSHPFDLVFLQMFLWFVSGRVSGRRKHCPEVSELCTSRRTVNETSHKRKAIHPSSHHF